MSTLFSLNVEHRKIAPRANQSAIILTGLALPPSVNQLFANVAGKGRVRTERYRAWAQVAGWQIKAQRPQRLRGPVDITLTFEQRRTRADIDNLAKAPIDLLVSLALIEADDAHILRRLVLQWGAIDGMQIRVQPSQKEGGGDA